MTGVLNLLAIKRTGKISLILATGEMIQNKVMFKQFIENKSLDYCQIDSCRIASINEILPVLLIASKFNTPVIPHAGGVGLCEYVQHLNLINKFIISNHDLLLSEYAESCSEHFVNPAIIKDGGYVTPTNPGYSVKIKDSSLNEFDYNNEYLPANTMQSKSPAFANLAHISESFTPTPIALITFSSFSF